MEGQKQSVFTQPFELQEGAAALVLFTAKSLPRRGLQLLLCNLTLIWFSF